MALLPHPALRKREAPHTSQCLPSNRCHDVRCVLDHRQLFSIEAGAVVSPADTNHPGAVASAKGLNNAAQPVPRRSLSTMRTSAASSPGPCYRSVETRFVAHNLHVGCHWRASMHWPNDGWAERKPGTPALLPERPAGLPLTRASRANRYATPRPRCLRLNGRAKRNGAPRLPGSRFGLSQGSPVGWCPRGLASPNWAAGIRRGQAAVASPL